MKEEFPALHPSATPKEPKAQLTEFLDRHYTREGFEANGVYFYSLQNMWAPKALGDAHLLDAATAFNAALSRQGSDALPAGYDGLEVLIPKPSVADLDEKAAAAVLESAQIVHDWSERARIGSKRLTRMDDEVVFDISTREENGIRGLVFTLRGSEPASEGKIREANAVCHALLKDPAGTPPFFVKGKTEGSKKERVYITEANASRLPDSFLEKSRLLGVALRDMMPDIEPAAHLDNILALSRPKP